MKLPMKGILITNLFVAALGGPVHSGTILVPSQIADLQVAINTANANDCIIVNGGTYPPIVIDKPLTIIGDATPTIDNTATPFVDPNVLPAIELLGPGSGSVKLVNVRTRGLTDGSVNFSTTNSGISGGGFDELYIEECDIESAEWFTLTGLGKGESGVVTSVPYVHIERSRIRGGKTDNDTANPTPGMPPGGIGISAPSSTVVVIDSDVAGGAGVVLWYDIGLCPGPCPCPSIGAFGGDGVVCDRLFSGGPNNSIIGGPGSEVLCFDTNTGTIVTAGKQPDGTPIVANEHITLGIELAASGPLELSQTVTLVWTTVGFPILLVSTPIQPTSVGSMGWLFLEPSTLIVAPIPSNYISASVPNLPILIGLSIGVQILDPLGDLTVPYISTIGP